MDNGSVGREDREADFPAIEVFERDPWTELELKEQIKTRREKDRMLSTSTL